MFSYVNMPLVGQKPLTRLAALRALVASSPGATASVRAFPEWMFNIQAAGKPETGFGERDVMVCGATRRASDDGEFGVVLCAERQPDHCPPGLWPTHDTSYFADAVLVRELAALLVARGVARLTGAGQWEVDLTAPAAHAHITLPESLTIADAVEEGAGDFYLGLDRPAEGGGARPVAGVRTTDNRSVVLYAGLWVVIGATATGKSSATGGRRAEGDEPGSAGIRHTLNAPVIDYGEPSGAVETFGAPALARRLAVEFARHDVVVVDSLKQLLLTSQDNLGRGGLSGSLNAQMSDWSASLARANRTLVVTLNPLGVQGPELDAYVRTIEGVAEAVIWTQGVSSASIFTGGGAGVQARVFSRSGDARGLGGGDVRLSGDWLVRL